MKVTEFMLLRPRHLLAIVSVLGLVLAGCGTIADGGGDRPVAYNDPLMVARPADDAWSQAATTSTMVYVAAQEGRLANGSLVPLNDNGAGRIRQGFQNMRLVALSQGATLPSCVRLVVYVTNMRYRPLVDAIESEPEFWGQGPKPPRTLVVVSGLDEGDVFEVQGDFLRVHD